MGFLITTASPSIALTVVLIIVGLLLILGGANYLTDGSSAIARRLRVSGFVIGLTVVAIGTSMPEMVVSVISALKGNADMSVGNIVGSNVFNSLVILGFCALFRSIVLTQRNIFRDIPLGVAASAIFVAVTWGGAINRTEGIVLLLIYIGTMVYSLRTSRPSKEEMELDQSPVMGLPLAIALTLGGLGALIWGGSIFINNATALAIHFNIPSNVIAITLVAGGTSLPEFAASLVSLIKGKSDIALGNVVGSNIANILLVLGVSSTITPLTMGGISLIDVGVVLLSSIVLFLTAFTFDRNRIDRADGVIMILIFCGYITWMLRNSLL